MRLVVLDRDGVINRDSPDYIKTPDEFEPLPGSIDAIARLCGSGFAVCLATNQSGIGRGLYDTRTFFAIQRKLVALVEEAGGQIFGVFFCPHTPEDDCECRKPRVGMLREIGDRLGVSLVDVPIVGDSMRDLDAARRVRSRPILVRTGNGRMTESAIAGRRRIEVYDDLAAVADQLTGEVG